MACFVTLSLSLATGSMPMPLKQISQKFKIQVLTWIFYRQQIKLYKTYSVICSIFQPAIYIIYRAKIVGTLQTKHLTTSCLLQFMVFLWGRSASAKDVFMLQKKAV